MGAALKIVDETPTGEVIRETTLMTSPVGDRKSTRLNSVTL